MIRADVSDARAEIDQPAEEQNPEEAKEQVNPRRKEVKPEGLVFVHGAVPLERDLTPFPGRNTGACLDSGVGIEGKNSLLFFLVEKEPFSLDLVTSGIAVKFVFGRGYPI